MIGIRDFNQVAGTVAQINEQLLKAQDSLFVHSANLRELQERYFEAREKISAMEKLIAERGRYSLFEISKGIFVYRAHAVEHVAHDGNPVPPEPAHYVCQRCFDSGVKVVLQRSTFYGLVNLVCSSCKTEYATDERVPHS